MDDPFDMRVTAAPDTLASEVGGEVVLLHLGSERYFGLDPVGTRMWALLTSSPSVGHAYQALLQEYDVAPERLRQDLADLLGQLIDRGLLEVQADA